MNFNFKAPGNYHDRQYEICYRSTESIIEFVTKKINLQNETIIDIGCGGGANIFWFNKAFPNLSIDGFDIDEEAIKLAQLNNKSSNFILGDFNNYSFKFAYDYVFSFQFAVTAPVLLEDFISKCLLICKKGVLFSSLFSEGYFEQYTRRIDLRSPSFDFEYKIFSIERLREIVNKINPNYKVIYEPFEIDIDLPKPEPFEMQTYTIEDKGSRIQISGYMVMPWYNVLILK